MRLSSVTTRCACQGWSSRLRPGQSFQRSLEKLEQPVCNENHTFRPPPLSQMELGNLLDTMDMHFHDSFKYIFRLYRDMCLQAQAVVEKSISTVHEAADVVSAHREKVRGETGDKKYETAAMQDINVSCQFFRFPDPGGLCSGAPDHFRCAKDAGIHRRARERGNEGKKTKLRLHDDPTSAFHSVLPQSNYARRLISQQRFRHSRSCTLT